ncbi:FecR domain-containing protein [Sphingobacterium prati]
MHLEWYDRPIVATIRCMQDRKRELENLIERYSSGRLTDIERAHLTSWLQELDVAEACAIDVAEVEKQMKEKIDARLRTSEPANQIKHPSWQFLVRIAATVIVCFSFAWYILEANRGDEPQHRQVVGVVKTAVKSIQMTCTVSQDSLILLQDGSKVHLLANSSITWMQPFSQGQRAIQLQGKAFFEVAHDTSRPFTVLADNILTTALGTSFWVIQETKNAKPKVRLVTGRVSIKERDGDGKETLLAYLSPGQTWKAAVVQPRKEQVLKLEQTITEESVPTALVFHHKPLAEVMPALASFYKTTILFSSSEVAGLSFYGTYTAENNIGQILQTICIANDLELQFNAETNTYTIVKNSQ